MLESTILGGTHNGYPRYLLLCSHATTTHGNNKQKMIYYICPPNGETFEVLANNEKEARLAARFYMGMQKLPKGTYVVKG